MSGKDKTKPEVFIIESLKIDDEPERREGHRLKEMLALSGKDCKYFYLRTRLEFRKILEIYEASEYRYLHLSCHGCKDGLGTTYNFLNTHQLTTILTPHVNKRRVFLSACEGASALLATALLRETKCYSVMGPYTGIQFNDAALFWASFYHLMFKDDSRFMRNERVLKFGKTTAKMFGVKMDLFVKGKSNSIVRHRLH